MTYQPTYPKHAKEAILTLILEHNHSAKAAWEKAKAGLVPGVLPEHVPSFAYIAKLAADERRHRRAEQLEHIPDLGVDPLELTLNILSQQMLSQARGLAGTKKPKAPLIQEIAKASTAVAQLKRALKEPTPKGAQIPPAVAPPASGWLEQVAAES
jgi:hypothetical protein